MQQQLKISLIQADLVWENPDLNRKNLENKIDKLSKDIDLIILPEMFTTGFTMNAECVAETMQGLSVNWMLQKAKEKEALLMGSIIIKEQNNFYNRFIIAFPSGELKYYNKKHLFTMANEDKVFTAGIEKIIFMYKSFRICPLICYDLRFPVWSRNTDNYDVLIYIANWPNTRIKAWDTLLKARAIENLCYVVGLNRVGGDKNKLLYNGHSAVIDALGETLLQFKESIEGIETVTIFKKHIQETRNSLRFLNDKDNFKIY
ncbi:MAG: amidohydrolase [Flavobacteriaceae bacterium]|nr:amidohydrolase [Flavobacteriaceae bacterium]